MNDDQMVEALNELRDLLHKDAKANGWHDNPNAETAYVAKTVANLHGEVSELWESYRNASFRGLCDKADDMQQNGIDPLTCCEEEMADIIIRVLDSCGRLGINIGRSVKSKAAYNRTRSYRHGGKLA